MRRRRTCEHGGSGPVRTAAARAAARVPDGRWNLVEGIIAIAAALASGSVALLGFGIDSFVEAPQVRCSSGACAPSVALWTTRRSSGSSGARASSSACRSSCLLPTSPSPPVPFSAQFVSNPVPAGIEAIATGRAAFQKSCVVCHGPRGLGDGAAAITLNPRPVNLQLHVPQHPDGEIYYWITEGVAGTAMAPWREIIPERERWAVVHYLRALAHGEQ